MLLLQPHEALHKHFGFTDFLDGQEEVISQITSRRDGLVVMPTGGGKSLCFQLPALLRAGLTVVVSPLISLMQDQVDQLREWGISAASLNSTLTYTVYSETVSWIRHGRVKLLYMAPETLLRPDTLDLLEQVNVDILAIDEAHCISSWGHDFRPEYRQLRAVRQRLSTAVCIALTATATERVRQDILTTLDIAPENEFVASFDRPNLHLQAALRQDGLAQINTFLQDHPDESGIIYCNTRKQVETLTEQLQRQGLSVLPYHAGLSHNTREHNQRQFSLDNVAIIVATVAFGMGIDKSNVRFVIHYNLPKDVESYYQEIGRAGRDGLPANCLLLYTRQDMGTIHRLLELDGGENQRAANLRLQALWRYAEGHQCRRQALLSYFGETYTAETCENCDNCLQEDQSLTDLTVPAQKFLSCVVRTGQLFGVNHIIDVLRGSQSKKVLARRHDKLSTYGIGLEFSKNQWQQLAHQFIQAGLLEQSAEHGGLSMTPEGFEVMRGKLFEGIDVAIPEPKVAASTQPSAPQNPELFAQLRAKRKALAEASNVPAFAIMNDRTLLELAAKLPTTAVAFGQIHGIGEAKVANYAAEFLPLIRAFREANPQVTPTAPAPKPATTSAPRERPRDEVSQAIQAIVGRQSGRTAGVWAAYQTGYAIQEIATALAFTGGTIMRHLEKQITAGERLDPEKLQSESALSAAQWDAVCAAFNELGTEKLRPLFDHFEEQVSYDELRLVRLAMLASGE
ncbi:MAG: DNA helicase RecQ [Anaerolineales bacterium]|nr:DNA helicase RecQ [Anaerolineales bacterium]